MTLTIRVTLPDLTPPPRTAHVLRALVPVAVPALLAAADAALDAGGVGLPARLLLHVAAGAGRRAAVAG
jgi:hypothetical protein